MDAVEFLKAAERRALSDPDYYGELIDLRGNDWVTLVAQVEQWAKDHPVKTRQSEFLKQWPNADLGKDGYLSLSPCSLDAGLEFANGNRCYRNCADCRREFWMQEVE